MPDPFVLIQTLAAIVTAVAAAGAFQYIRSGIGTLREHERVLFGEDSVDGWDGIVPMIQQTREQSNENQRKIERLQACDRRTKHP